MDDRLIGNARIVLEASCRAQPGETVLILVTGDALWQQAPALVAAARALGVIPLVMDIRSFVASPTYATGRVLEPLVAAIRAADIVISNIVHLHNAARPDYARLLGDPDAHDASLTAERRWVYLTCNGMETWTISTAAVRTMIQRTHRLRRLLEQAQKGRITSPAGTDLAFGLAGASNAPVLGIVPLYAEVAIVPVPWTATGVFVVDGPTQLDVRPATELDREPLRITLDKGKVVGAQGDRIQLARLDHFIASGNPRADTIDEVGILTTGFADNDRFDWPDGTHHHDCVHVALGNNERRDQVIHGPRHMDGEIRRPTIQIDERVIVRDAVFQDDALPAQEPS